MATCAPLGGRNAGFTKACCAEAHRETANIANSNQQANKFLEIFFITRLVMEIVRCCCITNRRQSLSNGPTSAFMVTEAEWSCKVFGWEKVSWRCIVRKPCNRSARRQRAIVKSAFGRTIPRGDCETFPLIALLPARHRFRAGLRSLGTFGLQPRAAPRPGGELCLGGAGDAARSGGHHLQPRGHGEERRARGGVGAREALFPRAHRQRHRGLDRATLPGGSGNLRRPAEADKRESERPRTSARRSAQRYQPAPHARRS